jgi:hypothetical protein
MPWPLIQKLEQYGRCRTRKSKGWSWESQERGGLESELLHLGADIEETNHSEQRPTSMGGAAR